MVRIVSKFFDLRKISKIHKNKIANQLNFFIIVSSKRKCWKIEQQLKVKMEFGAMRPDSYSCLIKYSKHLRSSRVSIFPFAGPKQCRIINRPLTNFGNYKRKSRPTYNKTWFSLIPISWQPDDVSIDNSK